MYIDKVSRVTTKLNIFSKYLCDILISVGEKVNSILKLDKWIEKSSSTIEETVSKSKLPECEVIKMKENMYSRSKAQWNPFVGCRHECNYCLSSFQRQLKRQVHHCQECADFTPHEHEKRLENSLPRTDVGEFIFTCSNGDVAFCSTPFLERILSRVREEPQKTFLIQSKNPSTFNRVKFPDNVILGTTIETTRPDIYEGISEAPIPEQRFRDLKAIKHSRKMVTIEPICEFDLETLVEWICEINPEMVWVGYDSKKNFLPEPDLEKTLELIRRLRAKGFDVIEKTIRREWWNEQA